MIVQGQLAALKIMITRKAKLDPSWITPSNDPDSQQKAIIMGLYYLALDKAADLLLVLKKWTVEERGDFGVWLAIDEPDWVLDPLICAAQSPDGINLPVKFPQEVKMVAGDILDTVREAKKLYGTQKGDADAEL